MIFLYYITALTILTASATEDLINSQSQSRPLQVPQYVERERTPILAYTLQLPRAESPSILFNNPETIVDLQPPLPSNQEVPLYYEYPEPSVDLQAPTEGSWNPNNDPNLYYNNIPVVLDIDTPTNLYPKKFDKGDEKKYSNDPKKEVVLKAIRGDELSQLQKAVNKIAKSENQKQIKKEKVPKKQFVHNAPLEPDTAYSEFNDNTVEDISADMIHSLGVKAIPGERYQFHMHGHKGPNSYKWGFDTGKGRNRQFRFEERDDSGYVKGQYGYYDKSGKLHMFHYDADPHGGFNSKSSINTE